MKLTFNNIYSEFTSAQKEIVKSILLLNDDYIDINKTINSYTININDSKLLKCSFTIIFHRVDKKISFYIDNDIVILNFEDYISDKDFMKWIIKSINLFLYSNISVKIFLLDEKVKKRMFYIEGYKEGGKYDYPIIASDGLLWFWQKHKVEIKEQKYAPWITPLPLVSN